MTELIYELLVESGLLMGLLIFGAGALFEKYLKDTKHEKTWKNSLRLIDGILESYDIDSPEFLETFVERLRDEDFNSEKEEGMILDEVNRKKREKGN